MPQLPAIPRPSATEKLSDLYNNGVSKSNTAVRGAIRDRGVGVQAWAWNKRAGGAAPWATNYVNGSPAGLTGDWAQKEFQPFATTQVTRFTPNGLNYAGNTLMVPTNKYIN
jgi:hypothetical protein